MIRLCDTWSKRLSLLVTVAAPLLFCSASYATDELMPLPQPARDNDPGFQSLFDGSTLNGWEGDEAFWRAENGAIVGETTAENWPVGRGCHSYLVWRGGEPSDFELRLEYRISPLGNSGVEYRSIEMEIDCVDPAIYDPAGGPIRATGILGNQSTIAGSKWGAWWQEQPVRAKWEPKYFEQPTGLNFDHQAHRGFLALPGQLSYVAPGERQRVLASVGDFEDVSGVIGEGWNRLHLIVRGNLMIHIVNGRVVSIVIDDDKDNLRLEGVLALKVAGNPSMKVEFRDIQLKMY